MSSVVTTSEFSLNAYTLPPGKSNSPLLLSSPSSDKPIQHLPHNRSTLLRSWYSRPFGILCALLNAWLYMIAVREVLSSTCFSTALPPTLRPPDALCLRLTPTFHQVWQQVVLPEVPPTYIGPSLFNLLHHWLTGNDVRAHLGIDFALRGIGATIIPEITTPTYLPPKRVSSNELAGNLPSIVLEEPVLIGDCWEFAGSKGHIGLTLAEAINISSITIHYVASDRVPTTIIAKAPRHFTVWALAEFASESQGSAKIKSRSPRDFLTTRRLPSAFNNDHAFYPIISAEYTIRTAPAVQSFGLDVPSDFSVNRTKVVVLEVHSNWDSPTTCLHHLGIYGTPLSGV